MSSCAQPLSERDRSQSQLPRESFFPAALEEEMQLDRERYPDRFEHIWLGDYAKAFEGAYYSGS